MRTLVVLAVITLAISAAIIHFSDYDFGLTPGKVGSPSDQTQASPGTDPQESFAGVANSLQHDMSVVPVSLDAPGVPPRAAFNVKSRLAASASTRKEYRTLLQVCDLIIYADQEHSVRQLQTRQAQQSASGDLMANAKAQKLQTASERTTIHTRAQADWEAYRRQTDKEVSRLLGSLQGANP